MTFEQLIDLVGDEPVFSSSLLRSGSVSDAQVRLQLVRWTKTGRIKRLRRGLYTLAPPYRKVEPHPFLVANRLRPASYVSLQSALAYHGVIPEAVPVTMSVTTARSERLDTPLGSFGFRQVRRAYFFGYRQVELEQGQHAFVARPEKALLDLIYLTPQGDDESHLRELRLQNVEMIDTGALQDLARGFAGTKIERAAQSLASLLTEEAYEEL